MKIEDYINYYKDLSLSDYRINDLDLGIMAILAYLPVKPFNNKKNIKMLFHETNDIKNTLSLSGMTEYSVRIINMIYNTNRYKDLVIDDFTSIVNSKTQFEAMKIKFLNNTIISFKGTDNSLIGWKENFRLCYMYPVYTQQLAINYVNDKINIFDKNIYIVGHSKGGNLAISSAMETSNCIFKRIKRVVNFDGPGVLEKELKSNKFIRLRKKLINYLPDSSIIGILMHNSEYHVVKADGIGFDCHDMRNWHTYGSFFLNSSLSKASMKLHENNLSGLKEVDPMELEKIVETFFTISENNGIKRFSDMYKLNNTGIYKTINDLANISSEAKKYFLETIKAFVLPKRSKK